MKEEISEKVTYTKSITGSYDTYDKGAELLSGSSAPMVRLRALVLYNLYSFIKSSSVKFTLEAVRITFNSIYLTFIAL